MDSIHVTNYELNIGLGLKMALVTDMHSMPYDDLLRKPRCDSHCR